MRKAGAGPRLKEIRLLRDRVEEAQWKDYPFNVPAVSRLESLELRSRVVFFVGENGSGKSTLLEAIADHCGYGKQGGSKNMRSQRAEDDGSGEARLARVLRLSWSQKTLKGFFLRAESFFNLATFVDDAGLWEAYGGRSLHAQSHGESFLALFENRFAHKGFYLMDEPGGGAFATTAALAVAAVASVFEEGLRDAIHHCDALSAVAGLSGSADFFLRWSGDPGSEVRRN